MSEFLARVKTGGQARFVFEPRPGSREFTVVVSPEEYDAIIRRGWARLDGVECVPVHDDCDPRCGMLRMRLAEPRAA